MVEARNVECLACCGYLDRIEELEEAALRYVAAIGRLKANPADLKGNVAIYGLGMGDIDED